MKTWFLQPPAALGLFIALGVLLVTGGLTAVGVLLLLAMLSTGVVCLASFLGHRLALVAALGCFLLLVASFFRLLLGSPL